MVIEWAATFIEALAKLANSPGAAGENGASKRQPLCAGSGIVRIGSDARVVAQS
jgi:hypothetical protein